jgi:enoyl-CoA hydratase/carnithine racemase
MNNHLKFGYEDEALKTWLTDDVAVIELKCSVYETIVDLAESGRLLTFIHSAEVDPRVSILLLTSSSDCFCSCKFSEFFDRIRPQKDAGGIQVDCAELRNQRLRYAHILKRLVMQLADFKKISAVTLRGQVVTPFFGASMAADIRFADQKMAYDPVHVRLGTHPGGALPFFLPLYIGYARAAEILLSGRGLEAAEALELGLINEILPEKDFLDQVIDRLKEFTRHHLPATLLSTKLLLTPARGGLERYFEQESALIF